MRQIASKTIASQGALDFFKAAGLKKPDISILSEDFLAEVCGMPQRKLDVELLRKAPATEPGSIAIHFRTRIFHR